MTTSAYACELIIAPVLDTYCIYCNNNCELIFDFENNMSVVLNRGKIVQGGHCTCRKDIHFRRRLLYCYEEVKLSQDDRSRLSSDSRLSLGKVYSAPSSEDKTRLQREPVAQRIAAVSESAKSALADSSKKLVKPKGTSFVKKKTASSPSAANMTPQLSRINSPEKDNLNASFAFTPKKYISDSIDDSFSRRSNARALNSSGVRDSAKLRHSIGSSIGDNKLNHSLDSTVSHWDLAHIEVNPESLEKYRIMSLANTTK